MTNDNAKHCGMCGAPNHKSNKKCVRCGTQIYWVMLLRFTIAQVPFRLVLDARRGSVPGVVNLDHASSRRRLPRVLFGGTPSRRPKASAVSTR